MIVMNVVAAEVKSDETATGAMTVNGRDTDVPGVERETAGDIEEADLLCVEAGDPEVDP